MASSTGPNLGIEWAWAYRESGWKPGMDSNLIAVDTLLHLAVINNTTTAPPGGPADGDRYLIPAGATGAWSGKTDQIAVYVLPETAWRYYIPKTGWRCWVIDKEAIYVYTGSAWTPPGTWEVPIVLGAGLAYLWYDDTNGFARIKAGSAPSSIADGALIVTG